MRHIWNLSNKLCGNLRSSDKKMISIRLFILLNSILWGIISVLSALVLKLSGLFANVNMALLIFVIAGYTICFLGIIGGEIYALKHENEVK